MGIEALCSIVQLESDPVCAFIIPPSRTSLTHLSIDERLDKVAKIAYTA